MPLTHVGNIFYAHGLAIITNQDYQGIFPLPPVAINNSLTYFTTSTLKRIFVTSNDYARTGTLNTSSISLSGSISSSNYSWATGSNGTVVLTTTTPGTYEIFYTIGADITGSCPAQLRSNKAKVTINVVPSCTLVGTAIKCPNLIITLTTAGNDAGPFDIYSDATGYDCPLATGISRASLLAGFGLNNVPSNATTIRVQSTGACNNYIDISIVTCTPSPVTPSPVTPAPVTPNPTPNPTTPAPGSTPNPTPNPTTPAPGTPAPGTPAPVTPSPVTPAPVTPSPVTPSPVNYCADKGGCWQWTWTAGDQGGEVTWTDCNGNPASNSLGPNESGGGCMCDTVYPAATGIQIGPTQVGSC